MKILKYIDWDTNKNQWLIKHRGVSFEEVLVLIQEKKVLADLPHPNQKKYPNQKILVINLSDYIYIVPYVEDKEKIFLKTIYPSRKYTKKFLKENKL